MPCLKSVLVNHVLELEKFSEVLYKKRHRGLVVLSGDYVWQYSIWKQFCLSQDLPAEQFLHLGKNDKYSTEQFYRYIPLNKCRHLLGQESKYAFISASHDDGIDANVLGIISGLLTIGGLLIIGIPSKNKWQNFSNPALSKYLSYPYELNNLLHGFNQHLSRCLKSSDTLWMEQHSKNNIVPKINLTLNNVPITLPTTDQQKVCIALDSVAFGHRNRPLIITADRGRGKSAALGIAAAQLIGKGKCYIAITSGNKLQSHKIFKHFKQEFSNDLFLAKNFKIVLESPLLIKLKSLNGKECQLKFIAPDVLIDYNKNLIEALLVDEAAHLSLPVLEKLLQGFPRIAFATTLRGYEGTGRGFIIRFQNILNALTPQWKSISLNTPIRWDTGDYLEGFINRLYLFNPSNKLSNKSSNKLSNSIATKNTNISQIELSNISIYETKPCQLWQDHKKLSNVFNLLLDAHYQTSPNDLMQLLEIPNLKLWIAENKGKVLGILLVIKEGNIPQSEHRLRGNIIPKQLYQSSQNDAWLKAKTFRIMRIAVRVELQRKGIGSALIMECLKEAQIDNIDYVSSCFGATTDLVKFWLKHKFHPVYLSVKRDKSSASNSLSMVYPLNDRSKLLTTNQQKSYRLQFSHLLSDTFSKLTPSLVLQIILGLNYPKAIFPAGYLQRQPYEACSLSLKKWALSEVKTIQKMPDELKNSFCDKVLQQRSWNDVLSKYKFLSRKELENEWIIFFKNL